MSVPRMFLSHSSRDKELARCFHLVFLHGCQLDKDDVRFTMVSPGTGGCSVPIDELVNEVKEAKLVVYLLTPSWKHSECFQDELNAGVNQDQTDVMIFKCCGLDQATAPQIVQKMTMWDGNDADQIRDAVEKASCLLQVEFNDDYLYQRLTKLAETISKEHGLDYELRKAIAERLDG